MSAIQAGYDFKEFVYQIDTTSLRITPQPKVVSSQEAIDLTLFKLEECLTMLEAQKLYFPCDQVDGLSQFLEALKKYLESRTSRLLARPTQEHSIIVNLETFISKLTLQEQQRETGEMEFLSAELRKEEMRDPKNARNLERLLLTIASVLNKASRHVSGTTTFKTCKTLLLAEVPAILGTVERETAPKWAKELIELEPTLAWSEALLEARFPEKLREVMVEEVKARLPWFRQLFSHLAEFYAQKPPFSLLKCAFFLFRTATNNLEHYVNYLTRTLEIERDAAVDLYIWVVRESVTTERDFQTAIVQLTKIERTVMWHQKLFLDRTPSLQRFLDAFEALEDKETTLSGRIALRERQLRPLPISQQERAILAHFIERLSIPYTRACSQHIKKSTRNLVRSLQVSPRGIFYLCKIKPNTPTMPGPFFKGSIRKVTDAILIPFDKTRELIRRSQVVNRGEETPEEPSAAKLMRNEDLHLALSDLPGIWPIYSIAKYVKEQKSFGILINSQKKTSHITDKADGNLDRILKAEVVLTPHELIDLILQLSQGLKEIHSLRMVHGKIKPSAFLFALTQAADERLVRAGIGNLNHAYNPESHAPYFTFERPFYQAALYTPPELFGTPDFEGDYYKVEAFAFGYILYKLLFNKEGHWEEVIQQAFNAYGPISKDAKQDFIDDLEHQVEKPYKELCEARENTPLTQLKLLVFSLLRIKPEERLSIIQFCEELQKCRERLKRLKISLKEWNETFTPIKDLHSIVIGYVSKKK